MLLSSLTEFRLLIINHENIAGVVFESQQPTVKDMRSGCYFCPRLNEEGDMHFCMDGTFNLPRRLLAGSADKIPRLNGLIRERILIDSFVLDVDARACKTKASNAQSERDQNQVYFMLIY